jgi:UDP-N-acetyl-D-mannosaminuronic acid dehydrogenase
MSIIGVVGIGYVGIAVATKFAEMGNQVIGFDIVEEKINLVNKGKMPIKGEEPRLPELIEKVHKSGNLTATNDFGLLHKCQIIIIAVETPFDVVRKRPLYFSLRKACEDVGKYLKKGNLVIIESTLAPRTTDTIIKPILEKVSKLKVGEDFNLCHAPERVMPGKLLYNLENLDRIIGGVTKECAERARILYKEIVKGEIDVSTPIMAEMVKTVENAYRDVQIAFANEIALLSEPLGIDVFALREFVNKSPGRNIEIAPQHH